MASGIDVPRLFNSLTSILKVRPDQSEPPSISPTLVAVYDVSGRILVDHKARRLTVDISANPADLFIMPGNRRGRLKLFFKGPTVGSPGLYIDTTSTILAGESATTLVSVGQTAGQVVICDVGLEPGHRISCQAGNVADTAIILVAFWDEWDYRS